VSKLMSGTIDAEERRTRNWELKQMAIQAMNGGSSYSNVLYPIEYVMTRKI
jgi:hypothetical protein